MPLTPQEQAELQALEAKHGTQAAPQSGISPQEQAELQALEAKHGDNQIQAIPPTEAERSYMKMQEAIGQPPDLGAAQRFAKIHGNALDPERYFGVGGALGVPVKATASTAGKMLESTPLMGTVRATGRGIRSLGDWLMQKSVGRTKLTPGTGTELAEQGIMGTKASMKGQVERRLSQVGNEMQDIAANIPGKPIDNFNVATKIASSPVGQTGIVPGAPPSAADMPTMQKIANYLKDVATRDSETASQGLARRKSAGAREFRAKEVPGSSIEAQLAKEEQKALSQALKESGGEPMVAADRAYAALKKAQRPLSAEEKISQGGILGNINKVGDLLPTSLIGSSLGQVATKVSRPKPYLDKALSLAELLASMENATRSRDGE